jgi:predicted permease
MTDLRLAVRMLVKQPGMAALAIIALALGIGLTTTMFSIVNGAVLRGLPFEDSERIYHFSRLNIAANQDDGDEAATMHDYVDWRQRQRSFEDLAAFYQGPVNVVGPDGTPERYRGVWITPNLLRVLRVQPVVGRDFRDGEEAAGAEPVVIISDKVWRDRFQASPDAIGQALRVNGKVYTVVGVMAPKFGFPMSHDMWLAATVDVDPAARRQSRRLSVIGRLKTSVTLDQAEAEFATISNQLQQDYPDTNQGVTALIKTYIDEFLGPQVINSLLTMLAAVFGVLIIACANVANLVLARAASRVREIAVRTAIGASRARVVRQMLTEVLLLAVIGAAIGIGIAQVGVTLFNRAIVDTSPPFWIDIKIDATVLAFVTLIAVVAAVVSGIVPALRASRMDLARTMSDEGRSTGLRLGRFSRGLVVAEMALSFGLLVVSGMVIQTIVNVNNVNFGFPMHDVLAARVVMPEADYPDDDTQLRFAEAVLAKVQALPGVVTAALATDVAPNAPRYAVKFPGKTYAQERDYPFSRGATVSADYFKVLRSGVVQGRPFGVQDQPGGPLVAVVNQSFARKFFPEGALGQQFALAQGTNQQWRTIVGLVPDLGFGETNQGQVREGFYLPMPQLPPSSFAVVIHAGGTPLDLVAPLREAVRSVDGNIPIASANTLQQQKDQGTWAFRVFGSLFMAFGFAALFLATVGLYGVMAFSVSRRTQEIGVRMALGAKRFDVLRLLLRQGLWQVALGILIGVGLAAGLASAMQALLFQVRPYDPIMFTAIALVLSTTALVACLIPARRASRVDPMTALRYH